jgi:hypothetical protein
VNLTVGVGQVEHVQAQTIRLEIILQRLDNFGKLASIVLGPEAHAFAPKRVLRYSLRPLAMPGVSENVSRPLCLLDERRACCH